jgi:hypothetical protein
MFIILKCMKIFFAPINIPTLRKIVISDGQEKKIVLYDGKEIFLAHASAEFIVG